MLIPGKRWRHFAAMALIGDGVMALVCPRRDAAAWAAGPHWWRSLMKSLHEHPTLTRAIGAAQIAGAVWWAITEERCGSMEHGSDGSSPPTYT
jgi:hypothetical protein